MFGCHHLNPDLRLKPCLVVIMMTTKLLRTPNLPLQAEVAAIAHTPVISAIAATAAAPVVVQLAEFYGFS